MNIYETIDLLKAKLEEDHYYTANRMLGYTIIADPYCDLSKFIPLILVEADRTEFQTSEYGNPASQDHYLSFSIFESAQKSKYEIYKENINKVARDLINKLISIDDIRIRKITPVEMAHNEAEIDSVRCTGIILGVKVRTNWED